jgi:putative membrane protein
MTQNAKTTLSLNLRETRFWASSQQLFVPMGQIRRQTAALFVLWLVTMISLPIVKFLGGEAAVAPTMILCVLVQSGLVLMILYQAWGAAQTVKVVGGIVLITWLAEALGTATGFPFGVYEYTDLFQPQLAHVPLLIPLAWLMMLPAAWAIASRIAGAWSGLAFVGFSALAMTAWDLALDPQMVDWGFWIWAEPSGYFGIPWSNFIGWALTSALITIVVRPSELPTEVLMLIYVLTWILQSMGLLLFWNLPGPAIIGFIAMGSLVWLAWSPQHRRVVCRHSSGF